MIYENYREPGEFGEGATVRRAEPGLKWNGWENEEKLTVEQAWQILVETPDVTSPEEYPDHALITMDQLGSFMARAGAPTSAYEDALRKIAAYDDAAANAYLRATGSYRGFDEPGAVEMARVVLEGRNDG